MTLFPNGASSFGFPLVGSGPYLSTGRIFFVDSTAGGKGDDTSHGATPINPFATLAYAVGQAANNRGDVIFLLPGHVETITGAAGVNINVTGLTIAGVTPTDGKDRAKVLFTTSAAASLDINAANTRITNLVIDPTTIVNIGNAVNVNAADCLIDNCLFLTGAAAGSAAVSIAINDNASRLRVLANIFLGDTTATPQRAVYLTGFNPIQNVEIGWNRITGSFTQTGIEASAVDVTGLWIHDNVITTLGTDQFCIRVTGGATGRGMVSANLCSGTSLAALFPAPTTGIGAANNWGFDSDSGVANAIALPIVGSTLATGRSLLDEIIGAQFSYNRSNYIAVVTSMASATWNTIATHEILTITGAVRLRIIAEITSGLTSGGSATLSIGVETLGTSILAATTLAQLQSATAPSIWYQVGNTATDISQTSGLIDRVIFGGRDVGIAVAGAAFTGGSITFHCWWEPINSTGAVVAGVGGTL